MKDGKKMVVGGNHGGVGEHRIIRASFVNISAFDRIDGRVDLIELSLERRVQDRQQLLRFARRLEQGRVERCDQRADPENGSQPHGCALLKQQIAVARSTAAESVCIMPQSSPQMKLLNGQ